MDAPTSAGDAARAWADLWLRPWRQMTEYTLDFSQRWLLYLDVRRQAANNMLAHQAEGMPPLLAFDHELILDGRELERPANYALLRIIPPAGAELDDDKPPVVVVDPRAGHGPGIGGFKEDSEVGMALREGFHTYFISFFPEPCPGQTLEDVELAEIRFLEEVHRRHPEAGRPVLYGNCQAGWAMAMLGADRPDVCGPIVLSGSPLSYWAGEPGKTPMRAYGGLAGGSWSAHLLADLNGGRVDGANLVANFERLNPANTLFSKSYRLLSKVDTEAERFLDFERWWTGFYELNESEIGWIAGKLFIGNDLEQGVLQLGEDHAIDLRRAQDPIVIFASRGDNITPPAQAFGWIAEVYPTTEALVQSGQRIVYLLHEHAGHLGIFVSASVARREHRAIIENLQDVEALAPGLYEMVIARETGEPDPKLRQFEVRFEPRRVEDLGFEIDDEAFARVDRLSQRLEGLYLRWGRPVVRAMVPKPLGRRLKWLHPARTGPLAYSERLNPAMLPVAGLARQVRAHRKQATEDNPYLQLERTTAEAIATALEAYRRARDAATSTLFRLAFA